MIFDQVRGYGLTRHRRTPSSAARAKPPHLLVLGPEPKTTASSVRESWTVLSSRRVRATTRSSARKNSEEENEARPCPARWRWRSGGAPAVGRGGRRRRARVAREEGLPGVRRAPESLAYARDCLEVAGLSDLLSSARSSARRRAARRACRRQDVRTGGSNEAHEEQAGEHDHSNGAHAATA